MKLERVLLAAALLALPAQGLAAKKKKAPKPKAASAAPAKKGKGTAESKNAGIVKKEVKKEGSLEKKTDYSNPMGSKAATEFKPIVSDANVNKLPTLKAND